jgi:hypothetical protein
MALSSVASMAAAVITEYEASNATFAAASTAEKDRLRDGLVTALLTVIRDELTTNATVSFTAGQITGLDSGGDTHTLLTAAGGSVQ